VPGASGSPGGASQSGRRIRDCGGAHVDRYLIAATSSKRTALLLRFDAGHVWHLVSVAISYILFIYQRLFLSCAICKSLRGVVDAVPLCCKT